MFINDISACRRFESNQIENAIVEKLLESLSAPNRRPREELSLCSVEVLHGWFGQLIEAFHGRGSVFSRPNGWE